MNTFVFQPGMTWRKLGFALYSNSLEYRSVLENNSAWSVTELPPLGAVLRGSLGSTTIGGATQQPSVYTIARNDPQQDFYPFSIKKDYYASLARYSPSALRKMERINGLTSDSRPALTGLQ